jgi:hypothetical protein
MIDSIDVWKWHEECVVVFFRRINAVYLFSSLDFALQSIIRYSFDDCITGFQKNVADDDLAAFFSGGVPQTIVIILGERFCGVFVPLSDDSDEEMIFESDICLSNCAISFYEAIVNYMNE